MPRTTVASLLIAVTTAGIVCGFWAAAPNGEWNILVTATAIAFLAGLFTSHGILFGMLGGAGFVVAYLFTLFEPDPSGLGPLELVMPFQLAVAALPMAVAAWLGGRLRVRQSA